MEPVRQYYVSVHGALTFMVPMYCEGAYELIGDRYCWQQWSEVRDVEPREEKP